MISALGNKCKSDANLRRSLWGQSISSSWFQVTCWGGGGEGRRQSRRSRKHSGAATNGEEERLLQTTEHMRLRDSRTHPQRNLAGGFKSPGMHCGGREGAGSTDHPSWSGLGAVLRTWTTDSELQGIRGDVSTRTATSQSVPRCL